MNQVLICERKSQKSLENAINNSDENLLGTLTQITDNIYNEVMEKFNPHGVIIADFDTKIAINFINSTKVQVIYIVPQITLENADEVEFIVKNGILVANINQIDNLPCPSEILEKIADLRKKEMEKLLLQELEKTNKNKEKKSKKLNVKFDKETLESNDFNAEKVIVIDEKEIEIPKGRAFVGVTELQHKIGCTHVCFEIAEYLRGAGKNVCVIIGDKNSYASMANYYGVAGEKTAGFMLDKIRVYPYESLEIAAQERVWLICDFGVLDTARAADYAETHFKIMLVAGAEWDLDVIKNYLNESESEHKLDQNYLFYPVAPTKFSRYNRQFQRFGCKAYRLQSSPQPTAPCKHNREVYKKIFGRK